MKRGTKKVILTFGTAIVGGLTDIAVQLGMKGEAEIGRPMIVSLAIGLTTRLLGAFLAWVDTTPDDA